MKIIETRLTEKEFINASMVIVFRKRITYIFPAIGIVLLLINLTNPSKSMSIAGVLLGPVIYLVLFSAIIPLLTYIHAKRIYNARSSRAKEKILYEFDDKRLSIKGESFEANLSWEKIYKVTLTKNWLFIYQNSNYANPIPKNSIWEGELMKLKEILDAKNVKHNLN